MDKFNTGVQSVVIDNHFPDPTSQKILTSNERTQKEFKAKKDSYDCTAHKNSLGSHKPFSKKLITPGGPR
jgi:hypothetical protein